MKVVVDDKFNDARGGEILARGSIYELANPYRKLIVDVYSPKEDKPLPSLHPLSSLNISNFTTREKGISEAR